MKRETNPVDALIVYVSRWLNPRPEASNCPERWTERKTLAVLNGDEMVLLGAQ